MGHPLCSGGVVLVLATRTSFGGHIESPTECPSFRRKPAGDAHRLEERRGVGAEALPYDGRPRRSGKIESTTFVTLTL
jgi:hypothetical protein